MNEKQIRISERIRVYKESPNSTPTLSDIALVWEEILELNKGNTKKKIGFTTEEEDI